MPAKGKASHQDYDRYKEYYLNRESSPEGIKKREERAKARSRAVADGQLHGPHDPRVVDHIKPLAKGGSNTASNTRVISATANKKKYDH